MVSDEVCPETKQTNSNKKTHFKVLFQKCEVAQKTFSSCVLARDQRKSNKSTGDGK